MYNTCMSSNLYLRSRGSYQLPCNNDTSYCLNERFERTPSSYSSSSSSSSSSSYCVCCACCINRVPLSSSLLYGLRQSTLLQFSASRKLMWGGGGTRYYYRVPVYGFVDRAGDYEVRCCNKCFGERRVKRVNGGIGCMFNEGRSGRWDFDGVMSDAEVMLSLLTEEVDEEDYGGMERDRRLSRRVKEEKRENVCDECNRRKKKNVGSFSLKSDASRRSESARTKSDEMGTRSDRRGDVSECETHRLRKEGSSGSSYESYSYLDDMESDSEIEIKYGKYGGESSSSYKKDLRKKDRITSEDHRKRNNVDLVSVGSGAKRRESNEMENRRTERREDISSGEKHRLRKEGSSGSSYYSLSHSDDMETDTEVQVEGGIYEEESSSSCKKDLRSRNDRHRVKGEVVEEFETHRDNKEERTRVSGQGMTSVTSYGEVNNSEWNRKKSEKRLTEASTEKSNSAKQYSEKHFLVSDTQGGSKMMGKQSKTTQEKLNMVGNVNEETRKQCGQTNSSVIGISTSRTRQESESLKISGTHAESNSSHQKQFHGRVDNSRTDVNFASEIRDEHTGQYVGRKKVQQHGGRVEIQEIDSERATNLQRQSETKMKYQDKRSTSVQSSIQKIKEENSQIDRKGVQTYESRKGSKDMTSTSVIHASDTETAKDYQWASEKRTNGSDTRLIEETIDTHNQIGRRHMQIGSSKGDQKLTKVYSFQEGTSEEASDGQTYLDLISKSGGQNIHAEEGKKSSQPMTMKPPIQLKARRSLDIDPNTGSTSEKAKEQIPVSQSEQKGGGQREETYQQPLNLISHEDALGSAERLEKSSMHLVGEFVNKARHELSTSEIQNEKCQKNSADEGEEMQGMGYGSEGLVLKENDSRRSSGVFGKKGPSDEMWHVTETSAREHPKTKTPEHPIAAENAIVKRTGRSMWNIIGDVVRFRWGSHADSHSSTVKSGGRSSSNDSVSTGTWFSGHEQDENSDKQVGNEQRKLLQQSTSADWLEMEKTPLKNLGEGSDIISSKDKIGHVDVGTSSSAGSAESGSKLQDIYSSFAETSSSMRATIKSSQGYPDSTSTVGTSLPLVSGQLKRSPALREASVTGKAEVTESDSSEQIDQTPSVTSTEVSGAEGKDGELKRRKFQRNKQVPKDRFDEWEDAYKREKEQQKLDEMFMREALLEAKKAADTWEVPVGAVLVQDGKIIARGCNLVEELRDSTAHAEIICIREASKLLRSWRIADSTLYVTLEPCPMCAGAILQARIDTLVWGAPNKLLGADGSWIRLFPSGSEGNGSELSDKPQAPVHPFHPKITIRRGVLASECADVMQQFFQLRRRNKDKKSDSPTPPSCLPVAIHPTKLFTKMHGIFNTMFCL